ncbi:hypothetical protein HYV84_02440 [Candidatus Woesearchaeota archaeon]|nr:hypothetical protein [Candidatus Woesearchaeota archaeon]
MQTFGDKTKGLRELESWTKGTHLTVYPFESIPFEVYRETLKNLGLDAFFGGEVTDIIRAQDFLSEVENKVRYWKIRPEPLTTEVEIRLKSLANRNPSLRQVIVRSDSSIEGLVAGGTFCSSIEVPFELQPVVKEAFQVYCSLLSAFLDPINFRRHNPEITLTPDVSMGLIIQQFPPAIDYSFDCYSAIHQYPPLMALHMVSSGWSWDPQMEIRRRDGFILAVFDKGKRSMAYYPVGDVPIPNGYPMAAISSDLSDLADKAGCPSKFECCLANGVASVHQRGRTSPLNVGVSGEPPPGESVIIRTSVAANSFKGEFPALYVPFEGPPPGEHELGEPMLVLCPGPNHYGYISLKDERNLRGWIGYGDNSLFQEPHNYDLMRDGGVPFLSVYRSLERLQPFFANPFGEKVQRSIRPIGFYSDDLFGIIYDPKKA